MDHDTLARVAYRNHARHPSTEAILDRQQQSFLDRINRCADMRHDGDEWDPVLCTWVRIPKEMPPPPKPRAKSAQPFHDAANPEIWEVFDSQTGVRLWTVTGNRETATREAGRLARGQGGDLSDVILRRKDD